MINIVNAARRMFVSSYQRMQSYPVYVCASAVRDVYLQVLRQYAARELPDEFYLCNVVLRTNMDGTVALDCFGSRDLLIDYAEQLSIRNQPSATAFELKGFIESCSAHSSQYCQTRVQDWQGRCVPWADREVLDPAYLSREIDRLDKLGSLNWSEVEILLQNVPVITLSKGKWQNRTTVLRWQIRLNWWRKSGAGPFRQSTSAIALEA